MSSETDAGHLPVQVDSSVRFAVIGPGKPYPTVLITTEQGTSELVGYYSLRELGMQKLLDIESRPDATMFDYLFASHKRADSNLQAPIASIDVWTGDNNREQLYSLVIQSNAIRQGKLYAPVEVTSGLEIQLRSIAKAHKVSDLEAIRYAAQILSTILGLVDGRATRILARRQDFYRAFFSPFLFAAAISGIGIIMIPLLFQIMKSKSLLP